MNPQVAILGHVNTTEVTADLPMDVTCYGYAHKVIPSMDKMRLATEYDLVIIQDLGTGCWYYRPQLEGLRGHRAKIVFWSFDSHHEHANEKNNTDLFDAIATAHSWTVPLIGSTSFWCPCSLVFHAFDDYQKTKDGYEKWFDWGFVGRRYGPRDSVLSQWRSWFEAMGTVFCGETDLKSLPWIYNRCANVFNVTYGNDLNIRFFEGLAAGCPMLITECDDYHQDRFQDLRPYSECVRRDIEHPEFMRIAESLHHEYNYENAASAARIVFEKHTLMNRYLEIAAHVL